MLAVASPPPMLQLDHDRHVERPTSPVFHSPVLPVFGPVQPVNGALNTLDDLLKHPLEFKQGCLTPTSGVLTAGIAEHKYKPINEGPASEDEDDNETVKESPSTPTASKPPQSTERIFSGSLSMAMPTQASRHPGFNNQGNTCFLNSVLQCLLHTPPLLNFILDHKHTKTTFCMICVLRDLARTSFVDRKRGTHLVLTNLNKIARGMRPGRQEDAHEFLRYSVDTLQRSALAIYSATSSNHPNPNKIPHALAETSWVHAIFGGRLRSRVSCQTCHHCSDTFDSLLDLSVDIGRMQSQTQTLTRALTQFVKPEVLSGADAYRCEKCKKPVTAEKSLTVHEAPTCLTIHLKRFTPTLRKNVNPVAYPEVLDLQPYMSKGQKGKKYALYGVIHHFGSGPNSGHYTAHVKGADGRWTMMDDESVTSCASPPLNHKSAYILFYIQNDKAQPTRVNDDHDDVFNRVGSQKRTRDDMESNQSRPGWKAVGTPIRTSPWDPFPASKKTRVEDTNRPKQGVAGSSKPQPVGVASTLGRSLVNYTNSDDIEDAGEIVDPGTVEKPASTMPPANPDNNTTPIKSTLAATSPPKATQLSTPNPFSASTASKTFSPTRPSNFYGQKKDKRPGNPFMGLSGTGNLHAKRDSSEKETRSQLQTDMGFHHFGSAKVKNRMKGKRPSL